MFSHADLWNALDRLAAAKGLSPSGLAKLSGLDPTSFNKSKRLSNDRPPRPRWPSTESLAKVLTATRLSLGEFAELLESAPPGFGDEVPPVHRHDGGNGVASPGLARNE
jgi:phage repressor protein C with HTH and peptisase S24 domain